MLSFKKLLITVALAMAVLGATSSAASAHNYMQVKMTYDGLYHNDPWFTVWYEADTWPYWRVTATKVGYTPPANSTENPWWYATVRMYSIRDNTWYLKWTVNSPSIPHYADNNASWSKTGLDVQERRINQTTEPSSGYAPGAYNHAAFTLRQCFNNACRDTYISGGNYLPKTNYHHEDYVTITPYINSPAN